MPEADKDRSSGVPWWVTAASVLIIPVVLTLITQFYSYQAQRDEALQKIQKATSEATAHIEQLKSEAEQKSRELDIHMVEIALSLVKPDSNEDKTKIGAREWAVDVIKKFSGIRFSAAVRKSIIETSVPVDKVILKGAQATAQPAAGLPIVEPFGRDEFVILDGPEHATKWTGDGRLHLNRDRQLDQIGDAQPSAVGRSHPARHHGLGIHRRGFPEISARLWRTNRA
jgi:hypothetical protein